VALLLDTHALLWWLDGDPKLSPRVHEVLTSRARAVFVSAASAWEITTKHRLGKLPGAADVAADVAASVRSQGFSPLAITFADAARAGSLQGRHGDPFDRMLIAQALARDWELASNEGLFDGFGVRRLW
jgi:PIN domain nuclease of toxin-antitoxin system